MNREIFRSPFTVHRKQIFCIFHHRNPNQNHLPFFNAILPDLDALPVVAAGVVQAASIQDERAAGLHGDLRISRQGNPATDLQIAARQDAQVALQVPGSCQCTESATAIFLSAWISHQLGSRKRLDF